MSLYTDLGGDEAIGMALDRFYVKVLKDSELSGFFDGVDVERIKEQQRRFLAMAFGGPNEYQGRDLRAAHARARRLGLDERRYELFMSHFRDTLEEFGVDEGHIAEVLAIADTGKDDVLGR